MQFSLSSRPQVLSSLGSRRFDLLVIGGGITGCGIALDAALRGMAVALVEKSDFASGTSSKSTKLIHGGLRYLKQMEFKLVHDVGRERAAVYHNARHIVIPEKMLLPIISGGSLGLRSTSLALRVYDLLAGVRKHEKRRMLSAQQTLAEEPLLNAEKIIGGGLYYEYRTDDARLVIELAKSATDKGALCLNYAEVKELLYDDNKQVKGALIQDKISDSSFSILAAKVVNATGPFVDTVRKADNSLYGKRLQLTKGVHIVFPFQKLPLRHAAYFDVSDGRMIFAIPRDGITYVGTTDTVYNQNIDQPTVTAADVAYLIKAVNEMFPDIHLSSHDVISSWAGLRPLIYEDGKSASELSRRDEVLIAPSALISIAGGKLTGYRLMAQKVTDLVAKDLLSESKHFGTSSTHDHRLSGGDFDSDRELEIFMDQLTTDTLFSFLPPGCIHRWIFRYGRNTEELLRLAQYMRTGYSDMTQLALAAEIRYCFENEMIIDEADFVVRRTGMLYFDRPTLDTHLTFISGYLSGLLGRDESAAAEALHRLRELINASTDFK